MLSHPLLHHHPLSFSSNPLWLHFDSALSCCRGSSWGGGASPLALPLFPLCAHVRVHVGTWLELPGPHPLGASPPRTASPDAPKISSTLAWLFTGRCAERNLTRPISCSLTPPPPPPPFPTLSAASPRGWGLVSAGMGVGPAGHLESFA